MAQRLMDWVLLSGKVFAFLAVRPTEENPVGGSATAHT